MGLHVGVTHELLQHGRQHGQIERRVSESACMFSIVCGRSSKTVRLFVDAGLDVTRTTKNQFCHRGGIQHFNAGIDRPYHHRREENLGAKCYRGAAERPEGHSPLAFARGGRPCGLVAVVHGSVDRAADGARKTKKTTSTTTLSTILPMLRRRAARPRGTLDSPFQVM